MAKTERQKAQDQLAKQATLAMNHGGQAVTAFTRSLLLLCVVICHAIAHGFTWADALLQSQRATDGAREAGEERKVAA